MSIRPLRLPRPATALAAAWVLAALLPAAFLLAACAAAATRASDDTQPLHLLVSTSGDWPSAAAFAERAAELAGVPVRSASAIGPRRFGLTLLCTPGAGCDEAQRRLLGDRSIVSEVQIDARRALPRPPAASQAL